MRLLLFLVFVFSFSNVYALTEGRCQKSDCLKYGWVNIAPSAVQQIFCRQSDCNSFGWDYYGPQNGYQGLVLCEGNGCFVDGFTEYNFFTGKKVATTTCRSKDGEASCMKYGWDTETPRGRFVTRCLYGDCEYLGWTTRGPGRREIVECKDGGCFVDGWFAR